MVTNHSAEKRHAVEEARQTLQRLPISWQEFAQAADSVADTNTSLKGKALKDAIVDTVLREWTRGMDY
jgi:hypothetical protein